MNSQEISFRPISSAGGMEVIGIDLHKDLCTTDKLLLKEECLRHSFLLIRNQQITLLEQLKFGEAFGEILEKDSMLANEGNFVTSRGEIWPHFDHWLVSGYPDPLQFTMLNALHVTPKGGETKFFNIVQAYRQLPANIKVKIENINLCVKSCRSV